MDSPWPARLSAQLLAGPPATRAVDVVEHLLAVQGQDPRGARLAVRARSTGLDTRDVDRALTEDRSLLITWVNRGTLHLLRSADYWWLHPLTTPQLAAGNRRRLAQEGVDADAAERGVAAVERAVTRDGPQTREQLREAVAAAGVPVAGQALVHVLVLASLRGLVVRGPMVGRQHAFVLTRDWLGPPPPPMERGGALAQLARRYLRSHGPAGDHDLARWAGLTLGDARTGLHAIAAELRDRPDGLLDLRQRLAPPDLAPPRLLGAFDPVLLGWASREAVVGPYSMIVTNNGIFRPFALVGGRAVGLWRVVRDRVELSPLEPLTDADAAALAADAEAVERFLVPGGQGAAAGSRIKTGISRSVRRS